MCKERSRWGNGDQFYGLENIQRHSGKVTVGGGECIRSGK